MSDYCINQIDLKLFDVFVVYCRTMGDRLGVAKASGNLGNTLKVMGKFKEAILCCERHLLISQELGDKVNVELSLTI